MAEKGEHGRVPDRYEIDLELFPSRWRRMGETGEIFHFTIIGYLRMRAGHRYWRTDLVWVDKPIPTLLRRTPYQRTSVLDQLANELNDILVREWSSFDPSQTRISRDLIDVKE